MDEEELEDGTESVDTLSRYCYHYAFMRCILFICLLISII